MLTRREDGGARPGFGAGMRAVFAGFGTIARTPSLWPYALVPVLVLLVLEGIVIALAVAYVKPWVAAKVGPATDGLVMLDFGAMGGWLATAALAVIGWFVAVPLAPPLSAPALEHIVRRVELELGVPPRESLGFFRELVCGFRALAGGLAVGVPILLVLWMLEFVFPPVVVLTTPLKFVVSSLLVAWGLFDYPLTLRGIGFRERLGLMRENFASVVGFGLAFMLVFWVPCCGVALLPVGVAAATKLSVDIERSLRLRALSSLDARQAQA
jgi:CysZ protein